MKEVDESGRYENLKAIMEKREQEEKERIRAEIREQLNRRTGISGKTPHLFLALKKTEKRQKR